MSAAKKSNPVWAFFASVKLALVLLFILATVSIIGTIIPQRAPADETMAFHIKVVTWLQGLLGSAAADWDPRSMAETMSRVSHTLSLDDMYNSTWFLALLTLFAINLVVCSLERIPRVIKIVRQDNLHVKTHRLLRMPRRRAFALPDPPEEAAAGMESFLAGQGWKKVGRAEMDDGIRFFAEKGAWTRFGVYIVHLSILVIFAGAMIGSLYGFKGSAVIPEGESVDSIQTFYEKKTIPLGFSVRCDGFDLEFYPRMRMPKDYRSHVTVIENGQEVLRQEIEVNEPMKYKGLTFYQSFYGEVPGGGLVAELVDKATGRRAAVPLRPGSQAGGEIGGRAFMVDILGARDLPDHTEIKVWFMDPAGPPSIFTMAYNSAVALERGDKVFEFHVGPRYYTGLQVTKDPGVWWVYLGCAMMLFGLVVAFFMSHRRLWVHVGPAEQGKGSTVLFAGSSNKNKPGFEKTFQDLTDAYAARAAGKAS